MADGQTGRTGPDGSDGSGRVRTGPDGWTSGRTGEDGRTGGRADGRVDGRTAAQTCTDGRTDDPESRAEQVSVRHNPVLLDHLTLCMPVVTVHQHPLGSVAPPTHPLLLTVSLWCQTATCQHHQTL